MLELLTISECARELSISVETARQWVRDAKLPATRTAAGWRIFRREDVQRLVAERAALKARRACPGGEEAA